MAASGSFPLLVEGSWGPDPPKNLINKLQVYFQSRKKSGGGECEVVPEPGNPARFRVLFSPEDGEGREGRGGSPRAGFGTMGARSSPRLQLVRCGRSWRQNLRGERNREWRSPCFPSRSLKQSVDLPVFVCLLFGCEPSLSRLSHLSSPCFLF